MTESTAKKPEEITSEDIDDLLYQIIGTLKEARARLQAKDYSKARDHIDSADLFLQEIREGLWTEERSN